MFFSCHFRRRGSYPIESDETFSLKKIKIRFYRVAFTNLPNWFEWAIFFHFVTRGSALCQPTDRLFFLCLFCDSFEWIRRLFGLPCAPCGGCSPPSPSRGRCGSGCRRSRRRSQPVALDPWSLRRRCSGRLPPPGRRISAPLVVRYVIATGFTGVHFLVTQ